MLAAFAAGNVQAAPISSPSSSPSAAPALTAGIDKAAYRCSWSNGGRHCRYYGYRGRYREYGDPDVYRYGSSNWWHEMDREERGGRR